MASSGLRDSEGIDRLLLVIVIAVLVGSLLGYALSLNGLRRQVDPHWKRVMSFQCIEHAVRQLSMSKSAARLLTWLTIPIQDLERCIPSRKGTSKETRA